VIEILTKDKTLKNGLDLCCGTGAIALAIKNNCP
jgi:methylase of polypeptide subunit release factors